jgi:chromosome segregation ATPase
LQLHEQEIVMSAGLKQELGLGEPTPQSQGSTEQADQFKAAFQAELAKINESLQYTAAHAEKEKHDPQAGKRDKTCSAFQLALGRIDPTNPSVAQGAIDQVIAAVKGLQTSVENIKTAVERAYNAWTSRESDLDSVVEKVREMVEWGHGKAAALQQIVDAIMSKANLRKYEEALQGLEQLLGKVGSIYEEFQRQKAAQEQYDAGLATLEPRLAETSTCEFASLEAKSQEIAASNDRMRQSAESKDYVAALECLQALEGLVSEYIDQVTQLRQKKTEYEAARAALDPKLAEASTCQFQSLAELDQAIAGLTTQMDEAAAADQYDQALQLVTELTTKVDEKIARTAELEQKKAEYEAARAALDPKLAEASTSQYAVFAELDQAIADLTTRTDEAATAEDYVQAVELVTQLTAKVDEKLTKLAELEAQKAEYEAARAALDPQLAQASTSRHESLAKLDEQIADLTTKLDAAAAAEDYAQALLILRELSAKVTEKLSEEGRIDRKIIGSAQKERAESKLNALDEESRKRFNKLAEQAKSPAELDYLTKSLAANYSIDEIEAFAKKINGKNDEWMQNNLRLTGSTDGKGVKQQWKHSCNATTAQAVRGELDPIYALKLHEENTDITSADNADATKTNPKLAAEQKKMLESKYTGGVAGGTAGTALNRGDAGKSGRWGDDLVNNMSETTGVEYANKKIGPSYTVDDAITDVDTGLKKGHPVPLVIGANSTNYQHYVLVTGRNEGPPPTWTIHDPWDGVTVTRSVQDIKDGKINVANCKAISALDNPSTKK